MTTKFLHDERGTNMVTKGGRDVIWNTLYLQLVSANGGSNSSPRTENVITKKENKQ